MIPLSSPHFFNNEKKYVMECLDTGWVSSAGSYVSKFEDLIKSRVKSRNAIACMNGTVGLQTALNLLKVSQGDLVLTTNLTFVATLNSISYTGAEAVLFDIDENTWQIDLDLVREWLFSNTQLQEENDNIVSRHIISGKKIGAIVPVHVLGGLVDIDKLNSISKEFHIPIIEDSTEALGSYYKNKYAGTFGDIGVFSFNGNKIITTGGGGMIVTNNNDYAKRARHITTTAKINSLDYFHNEVGYNYRLVNVLAAIGVAQLENFQKILKNKKRIDSNYKSSLSSIDGAIFQEHYPNTHPNFWLFTFRAPMMRDLLEYLNNNGIQSRPFWTPMNLLPMYSKLEYFHKNNVTKKIFSESISIPSSSNLTNEQQELVVSKIKNFYTK